MTRNTVQQLLRVFRLVREYHAGGMPLNTSYHEAVRTVAENYSVTYQTIGDGCRRRLELSNINELFEMLSAWVSGDPRALLHQLKRHSDPADHREIDGFFSATEPITSSKSKPSDTSSLKDETETVSFRLLARDARLLRALAELDGVSVGALTASVVSSAVRERMKVVARELIDERSAHA